MILPNFGKESNPDGIRRVAETFEELGFDSGWPTEHIIVGPETADLYGRVYDQSERLPLVNICATLLPNAGGRDGDHDFA